MNNMDEMDELDDQDDMDEMDEVGDASTKQRRLILIALVVVVLLCLVGVAGYQMFFRGDQNVAGVSEPPTATTAPTETMQEEATKIPTPTATPVISEPTAEPTEAVTEVLVDEADNDDDNGEVEEPAVAPTEAPVVTEIIVSKSVELVEVTTIDELLKNGDFEDGFAANGVGLHWESFKTDGADINFSAENVEPFVHDGAHAQRISVQNAWLTDMHAGIYQTVEVLPNQVYTLTLYGQIRSGYGSVQSSSYGYRMQYALEPTGGQNWQSITTTDWVELPWDEQSLDVANVAFSSYTTQLTTTSESLTLFVRTWNKWADPALVEFSLDSLSLVGVVPGKTQLVEVPITPSDAASAFTPGVGSAGAAGDNEAMIDQPLPITGLGNGYSIFGDGRFWGATVVLVLLAVGAIYRGKWG